MTPEQILRESFRIIEREVGTHTYSTLEWPIVRRMIHASGDVDLVRAVYFQQEAAAAGVRALRDGVPIVTDVAMVTAGINRAAAQTLGCTLHCFIDDADVRQNAERSVRTRSRCAMEKAIAQVGAAIYVVGNAPTALQAICDAVRRDAVRPHLVLALPVGFVAVAESKEEALALPVPVLAVRGRRGGSALAAAAVNAMLALAADGREP